MWLSIVLLKYERPSMKQTGTWWTSLIRNSALLRCSFSFPAMSLTCCQWTELFAKCSSSCFFLVQLPFLAFCCPHLNILTHVAVIKILNDFIFPKMLNFQGLNIRCAINVLLWIKKALWDFTAPNFFRTGVVFGPIIKVRKHSKAVAEREALFIHQ